MSAQSKISAIPLTTFSSASVSGSYQAINSGGLPKACSIVYIVNNSNQPITVSYDGINDHDYVRAGSDRELLIQTNAQPNVFLALMAQGTVVYIKGTAGTGTIALAGYYQQQQ